MPKENKTKYAVLGFLSMQPASGYEIKKMMAETTGHFWREGDSAIYPILKLLLDQKMVTCQADDQESNRPKKIYTITNKGLDALKHWLLADTEPYQSRNEFMLKVYFGWNVDREATLEHIKKIKSDTLKAVKKFNEIQTRFENPKKMKSDKLHRFLTLRAGIVLSEASLEWCDEAIQLLEDQ